MKGIPFFERAVGPLMVDVIPLLGDNYSYLIPVDQKAIVVDPCDAASIVWILRKRGLQLEAILVTHHHFDHIGGIDELKSKTGCRVIAPETGRIPAVDRLVKEGDELRLGFGPVRVLSSPGHTPTHVCYYAPVVGALWTGDTLFGAGCGRLFSDCAETMWSTLKKLAMLPESVQVFYGHEYTLENLEFALKVEPGNKAVRDRLNKIRLLYREHLPSVPSTIGEEKKTNPFIRAGTPAMKAALRMTDCSDVEVFAELRRLKDSFR